MRATRSVGQLAVMFLSLSSTASAASWPRWLPELDTLVVRQEGSSTAAPANTGSATAPAETGTTKKVTTTNLNTGGLPTATGTGKGNSTSKGPKHTMYNPQDPAANVAMITPGVFAGYQLYKLKHEFVTFVWNYTNLQGTPTAVDVKVKCSSASQTWTLTQNMTFATPATYIWDVDAFQNANPQSKLPTEQYTLLIHDSEGSMTDAAEPGYLAPFSGLVFGMYEPRAPTPLSEWKCASCSGAMSEMERRGLGAAVMMALITVFSFTWFVGGFAALL